MAALATTASFWLLSTAMITLPLGTAYAVWVGIGAISTAITAVFLRNEPVSALRILGVLLVLSGMVALKLARSKVTGITATV